MDKRHITVLLVDDHSVVRAGFRRLLEEDKDIEVLAEAESGEEACLDYDKHKPDVLVMDLAMPGIGGLGATQRILAKDPKARILVLSVYEDVVFPSRVIQAGALGYISKRCGPDILIEAVKTVAQGHRFLNRDVAQQLALNAASGNNPFHGLSDRQFEVFRLLAEGKSVNEIAEILHLSPKTVGTYQTHILNKLGVTSSAALARLAIRQGVIDA